MGTKKVLSTKYIMCTITLLYYNSLKFEKKHNFNGPTTVKRAHKLEIAEHLISTDKGFDMQRIYVLKHIKIV